MRERLKMTGKNLFLGVRIALDRIENLNPQIYLKY